MFHNISNFILMIVPLVFAVTIHEAAHGYVAFRMGDPTAMRAGRLTLNPIRHLDLFGSLLLPLLLKISGSPFVFGYAKPVPVNFHNLRDFPKGLIYVAAAGVTANLACAILSGILYRMVSYFEWIWNGSVLVYLFIPLADMLQYSVIINLVLMVFNLIPVPPLDGSRIVAMLLPPNLRMQFQSIERYGMIIVIILLMSGILGKIIFFFVSPLYHLLIGN